MATYPVLLQSQSAQTFQLQLDGNDYTADVYWLAFAQRLYIRVNAPDGTVVLNLPLISSDYTQNMLAGYFTVSTLTYNQKDALMMVLP